MSDTPGSEGEDRWERLVRSDTLRHGARVRPVPKRPPSHNQEVHRDPSIFASNLRNLIRHAGLAETEAPAKLGVGRSWLRRATARGLARIDKRTEADLVWVASYFGLAGPEEFWETDLPCLRHQPVVDRQVLGWREKVNWPYAEKLLELLETREHGFLKGLIDSLHTSVLSRPRRGVKEQAVVRAEPDQAPGLNRRIGRTRPPCDAMSLNHLVNSLKGQRQFSRICIANSITALVLTF
jgi:hypothetical protein